MLTLRTSFFTGESDHVADTECGQHAFGNLAKSTPDGHPDAIGWLAREGFCRREKRHCADPANWTWRRPEEYADTARRGPETVRWFRTLSEVETNADNSRGRA